jgi:glucose/arabinose dehydrogenase
MSIMHPIALPVILAAAVVLAGPAMAQEQGAQVATPGGSLPGSPEIQLVKVADGLADPVSVASAPDGSGRVFVAERAGRVRVVQDGTLLEEPFLDITQDVLSAFLEQGLYDVAFHPDFAENGFFFVHFAELMRNGDSVIVRYKVSADDPNRADPESAKLILQIDQPYANHNGGELEFGPDGYLYIGMGDGGWEGDVLEAGQDLATLLGKVLRIDVNPTGEDGDSYRDYRIPPDNPFARDPGLVRLFGPTEAEFAQIHPQARPEIWAYGLRNPWKFSFDPKTGDLWLPDVGQNHWEEINFEPADSPGGVNYGWDFLMGTHCFPVEEEQCAEVGRLPVAEYSHDVGCAVIDIGIYRGEDFPALDGIYFAGDYCSGVVWGLTRTEAGGWAFAEVLPTALQITGSGRAQDGSLYVTSCECHYGGGAAAAQNAGGALWRLVAASAVGQDQETAPLSQGGFQHNHEHGHTTQGQGGRATAVRTKAARAKEARARQATDRARHASSAEAGPPKDSPRKGRETSTGQARRPILTAAEGPAWRKGPGSTSVLSIPGLRGTVPASFCDRVPLTFP